MVRLDKKAFILFTLVISASNGKPAPQSSSADSDYGDDYGDYDETSSQTGPSSGSVGDIIRAGSGLAGSLLSLFNQKVKFINMLLNDQELRDQVGNTVASGINLTGEIVRAGVPLARAAIEQAPAIINGTRAALQAVNSDENRERVSQIAGVGTRVAQSAQRVASGTPELVSQGTRLVGSIIHAANDTAPLIVDGIQEFTDQIPLITGFASAYAEVNAEQTQKVVQTFYTSLQCDLQCRDLEDDDLKAECEVQFCKEKEEDDDDYYDV